MPPKIDSTTTQPPNYLPAVGLMLLALFAFSPAAINGYVWDDDALLTNNENIRTLAGIWKCWFDPTANLDYYPMTYTSWYFEYKIWGYNPAGFHVVNVLMHGMNAVLLWSILRMLNFRHAWMAAAIFAVHPVQVESVTWIAERKNTLSGFFYMLSAFLFLRFWLAREAMRGAPVAGAAAVSTRAAGGHWYALALLLYVLAMFAKPLVMTLAAGLVIAMWWMRGGRVVWRDAARALPFFALAGPMAALTMWVQKHHVGARGDEYIYSFADRVLVAGRVLCFYIYKLLLPIDLSFAYPRWDIDAAAWWQWLFPAIVVIVVAAAWIFRKRLPGGASLFAALLFFIATLSPALGFINVYWHRYYFVADHMQYLAMIAIAMLFVGAIGELIARASEARRQLARLACAALLIVYCLCSIVQSMAYADEQTLWEDVLAKNDDAWIAHNNLGGLLTRQGKFGEARPHFLRAIELAPRAREVFKNAMGSLMNKGQFEDAHRLAQWRLKILPDDANTLALAAETLALAGKPDAARAAYEHAAARITARLAAEKNMTPADEAEWRYRLGQSLLGLDRPRQAVEELRKSLALVPSEGAPAYSLSLALLKTDQIRAAADELRRLVQLENKMPGGGNPEHLARLALVLSASREPGVESLAEARAAAELANQISGGRSPRWLETLALVLAAQGDSRAPRIFDEAHALATQGRFIEVADRIARAREIVSRGERVWLTGAELADR